jgi:hypothetical protein
LFKFLDLDRFVNLFVHLNRVVFSELSARMLVPGILACLPKDALIVSLYFEFTITSVLPPLFL